MQIGILSPFSKQVVANKTASQNLLLAAGAFTTLRVEVASQAYPNTLLQSGFEALGGADSCNTATCQFGGGVDLVYPTYRIFNLVTVLRRNRSPDASLAAISVSAGGGYALPHVSNTTQWNLTLSYSVAAVNVTVVSPNTSFPVSFLDHNPRQTVRVRPELGMGTGGVDCLFVACLAGPYKRLVCARHCLTFSRIT